MLDSPEEVVTTIRVLNVPSYTNDADFNNWFLFASGFEIATLAPARGHGTSKSGWAKFESVDDAQNAINDLDGRQLPHCPEGTILKAEWANKNYKPSNPNKKRPHPDNDMSYSHSRHHVPVQRLQPVVVMPPPMREQPISSTLFLGKINGDVIEEDFYELFSPCVGFERLKFVPPTENKSGMCFAKFATPDHAERARHRISNYALPSDPDTPLHVEYAKNDLDQPSNRAPAPIVTVAPPIARDRPHDRWEGGRGRTTSDGWHRQGNSGTERVVKPPPGRAISSGGGAATSSDTMYVGNIAATTTETELVNALATMPGFVRVKFVGEGTHKAMAFVLFESEENCADGIDSLHGSALPSAPDQALLCQYSKNSLDKPSSKYPRQG